MTELPIARPYVQVAEELHAARAQKDGAYRERDMLVAALSKSYPSHLARHPDSDTTWEDAWRHIVCVHLPTGQATWHLHDSEWFLFTHLTYREPACPGWDGHGTTEKYARLSSLPRAWSR